MRPMPATFTPGMSTHHVAGKPAGKPCCDIVTSKQKRVIQSRTRD